MQADAKLLLDAIMASADQILAIGRE